MMFTLFIAAVLIPIANDVGNSDFSLSKDARLSDISCDNALTFSPDGKRVVAAANIAMGGHAAMRLGVWDISSGRLLQANVRSPLLVYYCRIADIEYSPDGSQLILAGNDGRIVFRDAKTLKQLRVIQEPWKLESKLLPPDKPVPLMDLSQPHKVDEMFFEAPGFVSLAVSPDGNLVAGGMSDGTVQIWHSQSGKHMRQLGKSRAKKRRYRIETLFKSGKPSRDFLRGLSKTNTDASGIVRPTHFEIWAVPRSKRSQVSELTFDSKGMRLIGWHAGGISMWEVKTGKRIFTIPDGTRFSLSPNGKWIACNNSRDFVISLYDANTGKKLRSIPESRGAGAVVFSADSNHVISGGRNGRIRIWNVHRGGLVRQFPTKAPGGPVRVLKLSADGAKVCGYWPNGGGVRIWDLKSGREIGQVGSKNSCVTKTLNNANSKH